MTIGDWGYQPPTDEPRDPATGPPKSLRAEVFVSADPSDPVYTEHLNLIVWVRSVGGVVEIAQLAVTPGEAHPPGGLATTDLRDIPLQDISRAILSKVRTGEPPSGWEGSPFVPPQPPRGWATSLAKRSGRAGKGDLHYALFAAEYVQLLDRPKPVVLLAKKRKLKPSQVRSILYEARRRDLLTDPPVKGRPGGELTPEALDVLRQHHRRTEDE